MTLWKFGYAPITMCSPTSYVSPSSSFHAATCGALALPRSTQLLGTAVAVNNLPCHPGTHWPLEALDGALLLPGTWQLKGQPGLQKHVLAQTLA